MLQKFQEYNTVFLLHSQYSFPMSPYSTVTISVALLLMWCLFIPMIYSFHMWKPVPLILLHSFCPSLHIPPIHHPLVCFLYLWDCFCFCLFMGFVFQSTYKLNHRVVVFLWLISLISLPTRSIHVVVFIKAITWVKTSCSTIYQSLRCTLLASYLHKVIALNYSLMIECPNTSDTQILLKPYYGLTH